MKYGMSLCTLALLSGISAFAPADDHPLINAFPGARERNVQIVDYEPFSLPTGIVTETGDTSTYPKLALTGDLARHFYLVEGVSTLKIYKNYVSALKDQGFNFIFQCELDACGDNDQSAELGALLSVEDSVYNYYVKPYYLVAEKAAQKGKIYVAVFVGSYDGDAAIQQVIVEEEPLETGLLKIDEQYIQSQPPASLPPQEEASDLDRDHPLFSRYPGARIYNSQKIDYETIDLPVSVTGSGSESFKVQTQPLTGDISRHFYTLDHVSSLKVFENYRAALAKAGFTETFQCSLDSCGNTEQASELGGLMSVTESVYNYYHKPYFVVGEKNADKGKVYAAFFVAGYEDEVGIQQTIVETEAAETGLIKVDADSLLQDLEAKGKAVIYGIYFDTDKATIKPESKPALDEISKLLQRQPDLLLYVVGHTDDSGSLSHNLELSDLRADAVTQALVKDYQIDSSRLIARGVGPFAPESNNTSTQGKTLNRRVELVKRIN